MNTKIELKSDLYKLARLGKSSFIYEIAQNMDLDFDERYMENNQIISVYDKENNLVNEYEFDEDENYLDPLNRNVPHIFTLYNRLSPAQRTHLLDFSIIYSIENACEKEFNQEEKSRLLEIINDAFQGDDNNTDRATISDEIVRAYAEGEVSLEALENADTTEVLDCIIGLGSFSSLEDYIEEEDEEDELAWKEN